MSLEWENVTFKKMTLAINDNYIYFNSAFRDKVGNIKGINFYKASQEGKEIIACKPGEQFYFAPKKNEIRLICKELADYIKSVYIDQGNRFELILDKDYYILVPFKD